MADQFHAILKVRMNEFAHLVYAVTKSFPREEMFGAVSQLRRAALSIVLNYVEGFARKRYLVRINFFEISYGSLRESKYLVQFAYEEKWIEADDYERAVRLAEQIGAMLWKTIEALKRNS